MKKYLISLLVSAVILLNSVATVSAAGNPAMLMNVDCDTLEKHLNVGFQTDPEDPANGVEIIVFKFVFQLEPTGSTVIGDLESAIIEENNSYPNIIVAKKSSNRVGDVIELVIEGGFTQQNGVNNVDNLFFIRGTNEKSYKISVTEGELIPINTLDNIYVLEPIQEYTADPSACSPTPPPPPPPPASGPETHDVLIDNLSFVPAILSINVGDSVKWTNSDSISYELKSRVSGPLDSGTLNNSQTYSYTFSVAGTYQYEDPTHPTMIGVINVTTADSGDAGDGDGDTTQTQISLSTDKTVADVGDDVTITGIITNRYNNPINWSQISGTQVSPQIQNTEVSETELRSEFTFTMPASSSDISIRLTVGPATETIRVSKVADAPSAPSAPTDGGTGDSLQDRLDAADTGDTTPPVTDPGNIHDAASGLTESGPGETTALVLISIFVLIAWKSTRKALS